MDPRTRRRAINVLDDLVAVLGEYGGTFDPVTNSHVRNAAAVLRTRLDQLQAEPVRPMEWDEPTLPSL